MLKVYIILSSKFNIFYVFIHRVYLFDLTKCHGSSFSDHKLFSFLNEFCAIFESEADYSCVTISHDVGIFIGCFLSILPELDDLYCLCNTIEMKHTLVSFLNCGVMMEDSNVSIEMLDAHVVIWVFAFDFLD